MDPSSIPKKYGGQLEWTWGNPPDLDVETREALERDGNKGWVKGPALWLNNERIVVGSENGKLRRSDKEIAEKKPIVYSGDYTEEPGHPEKRLSVVSASKKNVNGTTPPNGTTMIAGHPSPLPESPSTLVEDRQLGAPTPAVVPVAAPSTSAAPTTPQQRQKSPIPSHIPVENVRTSPMGDSQVHLPDNQAAPPATTAEYISPTHSKEQVAPSPSSVHAVVEPQQNTPVLKAAPTTMTSTAEDTNIGSASPPPPGHTQPGPLSAHLAETNRMIARKLEGESVVTIPASADGALPHPDIIATSDAAKGLAIEAEKLTLAGTPQSTRPEPERFVTALEIIR